MTLSRPGYAGRQSVIESKNYKHASGLGIFFSGQFNWQDGTVWQVGFVVAAKEIPAPDRIHICSALVDAGASVACISSSVVEEHEFRHPDPLAQVL